MPNNKKRGKKVILKILQDLLADGYDFRLSPAGNGYYLEVIVSPGKTDNMSTKVASWQEKYGFIVQPYFVQTTGKYAYHLKAKG